MQWNIFLDNIQLFVCCCIRCNKIYVQQNIFSEKVQQKINLVKMRPNSSVYDIQRITLRSLFEILLCLLRWEEEATKTLQCHHHPSRGKSRLRGERLLRLILRNQKQVCIWNDILVDRYCISVKVKHKPYFLRSPPLSKHHLWKWDGSRGGSSVQHQPFWILSSQTYPVPSLGQQQVIIHQHASFCPATSWSFATHRLQP